MKKIAIIAIASLLVLVIGVLIYAGSQAGSLVSQYKPDIEKAASDILGSQVTLGEIDLSIFPTVKAQIANAQIKPKASSTDGLQLQNLFLGIKLLPLLSGRLEISNLKLDAPDITIINDKQGIYIAGLPPTQKSKSSNKSPQKKNKQAKAAEPTAISSPLDISLNSILINDAKLTFEDQVANKSYSVSDVDLETGILLSGDTLTLQGLELEMLLLGVTEAEVTSDAIALVQSTGELTAPKLKLALADSVFETSVKININNFKGGLNLTNSALKLSGLEPLIKNLEPSIAEYKLAGTIKPDAKIRLENLEDIALNANINLANLGAQVSGISFSNGAGQLSLMGKGNEHKVAMQEFKINLGSEQVVVSTNAVVNTKQAQLESLAVKAFGGAVSASGALGFSNKKQLNSEFEIAGIQLEPALKTVAPGAPIVLLGSLHNVAGRISGSLAGQRPLAGLRGSVQTHIKDGKLVGVNLLGKVIKALTEIPLISLAFTSKIPTETKEAMEGNDTLIEDLTANFNLANEQLRTRDLVLKSTVFTLRAQGTIGMDSSINLKSQFHFNPVVSQAFVLAVKELDKLVNENGELVIPIALSGTGGSIIVLPDVVAITTAIAKGAIREKAGEFISQGLGKLFGG